MKQRGIVIVIAVVLISGAAIVIVVRAFHGRRNSQDYSGTIETREIEVGSKIGGRVTEVSVEEGQEVMAGALLVRFESNDLIAQRRQAQAEVDQQRTNRLKVTRGNRPEEIQQSEANARALSAAFEEARNGPRPQDIAQAQADYEAAQADAINAQSNFERMQKLVETDTIWSLIATATNVTRPRRKPSPLGSVSPSFRSARVAKTYRSRRPIISRPKLRRHSRAKVLVQRTSQQHVTGSLPLRSMSPISTSPFLRRSSQRLRTGLSRR